MSIVATFVTFATFTVTVRFLDWPDIVYCDVGTDSGAVGLVALTRFGACGVSVKPA